MTLIICQRISDRRGCNIESTPACTGQFVAWLTELGGAVCFDAVDGSDCRLRSATHICLCRQAV